MDELIVFLLFGWMELLVKPSKSAGGFIVAWIFVAIVSVSIYVAVAGSDEPDEVPTNVEQVTDKTEQAFIDLCKRNDGTPSRDINDPEKLICL